MIIVVNVYVPYCSCGYVIPFNTHNFKSSYVEGMSRYTVFNPPLPLYNLQSLYCLTLSQIAL